MEDTPNSISRDIISRVIHSELAIADVSDSNPNVFYELAIRNAVNKPVIVIRKLGQKLPFDIYDKRAITIDMTKNREWVAAKDQLAKQVKNAEHDPIKASESIVSDFTFNINTKKPENPQADIAMQIKDLKESVSRLTRIVVDDSEHTFQKNYPSFKKETQNTIKKVVIDSITVSSDKQVVITLHAIGFEDDEGVILQLLDPDDFAVKKLSIPATMIKRTTPILVDSLKANAKKGTWHIMLQGEHLQIYTMGSFVIE